MTRLFLLLCIFTLTLTATSAAETVPLSAAQEPYTITLLSGEQDRILLELKLNGFSREALRINGDEYTRLRVEGLPLRNERGLPALPTLRESLRIPDDAEIRVRIVDAEYREFTDSAVAPSKGPLYRSQDPAAIPYTFDRIYDDDVWFPAEVAALGRPYIMRDSRGVVLELNLCRCNPARRLLRVYTRLIVAVEVVGPGRANILDSKPARGSQAFEHIFRNHYLNAAKGPLDRYARLPEYGSLLVVVHDAFRGAMQPFVDWKNQMGMPTEMVDISAIGSSAVQLKAYLQDVYDTEGLTYILLVGDAEYIPSFSNNGGAADPMMTLLAGDDDYPDAFIGRFSAENAQQVATQVARSITYERDPLLAGDGWYESATCIGSNDDGGTMIFDWEWCDVIRAMCLDFSYTEIDRLYDPGVGPQDVATALEAGRSLINYIGHGGATGWSTSHFSVDDVNALQNEHMLPWILSLACSTGHFTGQTCFAEAWLRATSGGVPTGGVGFYASTVGMQWTPPIAANLELIRLLTQGEQHTLGPLCFNGSCKMIDEYGLAGEMEFRNWTLFGDPSLRLRSAAPVLLSVGHDGAVDPLASEFIVVTEPGALVGLSDTGSYFGSAISDAQGVAAVEIVGPLPPDEVTLTVTGFNRLPHIETLPVGATAQPACSVSPAALAFSLLVGESSADVLYIENTGEPGSLLHCSISLSDPDFPGKRDERDLTDSYALLSPTVYFPQTSREMKFDIVNESTDEEWIERVELQLPAGISLDAASPIYWGGGDNIPYAGGDGDGATAIWEGPDPYDVVFPGNYARAYLTVSYGEVSGELLVPYSLIGDGWGEEPHRIDGVLPLGEGELIATVVSPNGGESWPIGAERLIHFMTNGNTEFVDIELQRGEGAAWETLAESAPAELAGFPWTVTGPSAADCRIRVSDAADPRVSDQSDAGFTIHRGVDWLQLGLGIASIAAGDTLPVPILIDTAGLPAGSYRAEIVVAHSAGEPMVIPVDLDLSDDPTAVPAGPPALTLARNHPNPFNPSTTIRFTLPEAVMVELSVYDCSGRRVQVLWTGRLPAGPHSRIWDGRDAAGRLLASGVYLARLSTGNRQLMRKMLLLK